MRPAFYDSLEYKVKQSKIAKLNWAKGKYKSLIKQEIRVCGNPLCKNNFSVKPYDPKNFCSHRCAASFNNRGRIQNLETRKKISESLKGMKSPFLGMEKVKRVIKLCEYCEQEFFVLPYLSKIRRFCSNKCAMSVIGGQTTSPKASKGKPGVRLDIGPDICFYSTWEANIARVFNLVGINWIYAPTIFKLEKQTYRPDFYLQDYDTYIEVKNFLSEYSYTRDKLFRKFYPHIKLYLILKKHYQEIEENYKGLIDFWE